MGMIEFEDHSEENQKALLAYLDAQESNNADAPPGTGLVGGFCRRIRLAWTSLFRCSER
jgi:hypothetical protein